MCEAPYETDAQRNRSVSAGRISGCMENQQAIEPTLLLIQCAAGAPQVSRAPPIERAFLFAEWPTGRGSTASERSADDPRQNRPDRTARGFGGSMAQHYETPRDSGHCPRDVAARWPRGYIAPILRSRRSGSNNAAHAGDSSALRVKSALDYLVG